MGKENDPAAKKSAETAITEQAPDRKKEYDAKKAAILAKARERRYIILPPKSGFGLTEFAAGFASKETIAANIEGALKKEEEKLNIAGINDTENRNILKTTLAGMISEIISSGQYDLEKTKDIFQNNLIYFLTELKNIYDKKGYKLFSNVNTMLKNFSNQFTGISFLSENNILNGANLKTLLFYDRSTYENLLAKYNDYLDLEETNKDKTSATTGAGTRAVSGNPSAPGAAPVQSAMGKEPPVTPPVELDSHATTPQKPIDALANQAPPTAPSAAPGSHETPTVASQDQPETGTQKPETGSQEPPVQTPNLQDLFTGDTNKLETGIWKGFLHFISDIFKKHFGFDLTAMLGLTAVVALVPKLQAKLDKFKDKFNENEKTELGKFLTAITSPTFTTNEENMDKKIDVVLANAEQTKKILGAKIPTDSWEKHLTAHLDDGEKKKLNDAAPLDAKTIAEILISPTKTA